VLKEELLRYRNIKSLFLELPEKMVAHHIGACCLPVTEEIEDSNSFATALGHLRL